MKQSKFVVEQIELAVGPVEQVAPAEQLAWMLRATRFPLLNRLV